MSHLGQTLGRLPGCRSETVTGKKRKTGPEGSSCRSLAQDHFVQSRVKIPTEKPCLVALSTLRSLQVAGCPYPQRKIIGPTFFRMKYGTRQSRIPLDIVDKKTRSRIMSRIRGQDTKPEIALRKSLHARGFRYRTHARDLPGKPDLVFPRFRAIVLVHGCFWHRHLDCRLATTPASNMEFWQRKFQRTVERDQRVLAELLENGWRVATVWECALGKRDLHLASSQLAQWLKSDELQKEIPFSGAHC